MPNVSPQKFRKCSTLLVGLVALYLTGCASGPVSPAASQEAAQRDAAEKAVAEKAAAEKAAADKQAADAALKARNAAGAAAGGAGAAAAPKAAHLDPASSLNKQRSAYFDFDKFEVKPADQKTLKQHADYLAGQKGLKVKIEGNADERGSREYNLALGQKRADAMRTSLKAYGIKDERIETVSNGKEKPRATGHDEAAWAENRRGDIVYSGE